MKEVTITNFTDIKFITRKHNEHLCLKLLDNLDEKEKFLET